MSNKLKVLVLVFLAAAAAYVFVFQKQAGISEDSTAKSESMAEATQRIKIKVPHNVKTVAVTAVPKAKTTFKPKPKAETKVVEVKTEPKKVETVSSEPAKPKVEPTPVVKTETAKKPVDTKSYVVNMASFTARSDADSLKRKISGKGYLCYVTTFNKDGTTWYRVRVGFYSSYDEGKKYARILSEKFSAPDAWVTRPTSAELSKYAR